MKKNQWIYLIVAGYIAYYWWKKKGSPKAKASAPILEQASAVAADVVSKAVDATNFVMDETTDRERYSKQQGNFQ